MNKIKKFVLENKKKVVIGSSAVMIALVALIAVGVAIKDNKEVVAKAEQVVKKETKKKENEKVTVPQSEKAKNARKQEVLAIEAYEDEQAKKEEERLAKEKAESNRVEQVAQEQAQQVASAPQANTGSNESNGNGGYNPPATNGGGNTENYTPPANNGGGGQVAPPVQEPPRRLNTLGNSGMEFATMAEAMSWGSEQAMTPGGQWELKSFTVTQVDYSDGSFTFTVGFY